MPFDGVTTKPNLALLADVLRDGTKWPRNFRWHYESAESCAVGLARRLWTGYDDSHHTVSESMAHWFGLPNADACAIFIKLYEKHKCSSYRIMPNQVADAIDLYLKR